MDFDNKTNNNKLEDGCSIEVLFRDHHITLFSACLVSLILGFPLAWNILWHLRVWFITTDEALVRFLIVHSHNFTHEENCDLKSAVKTLLIADSHHCKRERGPQAPLNSAADQPPLCASSLLSAFHNHMSIWKHALIALPFLASSVCHSSNKPRS